MGAYCDLCGFSRDACPDPAIVEKRFEITRTVSDLQALFEEIGRDHGGVVKSHSDYSTRKGLTRKPIPSYDVISVQVLHALSRTSDHFMKITVYLTTEVFECTESGGCHYHHSLIKAKREILEKIEEMIGERWDFTDGTGKGRNIYDRKHSQKNYNVVWLFPAGNETD